MVAALGSAPLFLQRPPTPTLCLKGGGLLAQSPAQQQLPAAPGRKYSFNLEAAGLAAVRLEAEAAVEQAGRVVPAVGVGEAALARGARCVVQLCFARNSAASSKNWSKAGVPASSG